jgi:hypothetical protein
MIMITTFENQKTSVLALNPSGNIIQLIFCKNNNNTNTLLFRLLLYCVSIFFSLSMCFFYCRWDVD